MIIPNDHTYFESSNSSFHPDVFLERKPLVKAKYRSILHTTSSLLLGFVQEGQVTDIFDHATVDILSVGGHLKAHGTMESHTAGENPPVFNAESRIHHSFPTGTSGCGMSHRTEDILYRVDEDGNRSHYCPLDEDKDRERDENEDFPDRPMLLDDCGLDAMLKGCNVDSDVPYMMAEKPPSSSESEGNAGSDVDSSTSMIYAPIQNFQPLMNEEDASFLQILTESKKQRPQFTKLDKKTMEAWADDSSDEYDDSSYHEEDVKLPEKPDLGEESDMEEFNETFLDEKKKNMQKSHRNHKDKDKSFTNCPNGDSEVERSRNENSDRSHEEISNLEKANKDELDKNYETEGSSGEFISQPYEDQTQIDAVLKAEVEDAISKAETLGIQENDMQSRDFRWNGGEQGSKTSCSLSSEVSSFQDSNEANTEPSKEEKEENLTMEPVAMNLTKLSTKQEAQPDLKTALRFLTEVYPTKDEDDELYFDSLSMEDMPVGERSKMGTNSGNFQDAQRQEATEGQSSLPSVKQPRTFEPILKETHGHVTRPRNKFTKFFKSFTKKLGKKA